MKKIVQFIDICGALIKAKEEGMDAFTALDSVMPWNKIVESVEEAKQLSRPANYDYLDLLETRYSYLRKIHPPHYCEHLNLGQLNLLSLFYKH
ncbi:hypothetical protein GCM10020331_093250 [Ectobacillus funiculus]